MISRTLARTVCVAALFVGLASCGKDLGLKASDLPFVGPSMPKPSAIVVGDEPYAVRSAADVMAQGGNAVDAVTSLYFAMSVTYPVAAGLGGGGICLIHDGVSGRDEEFDFLARDAASGGAFAIPGNVRGFAALHASIGALPWQRVISAAEQYASTGFPISQALATRLSSAENVIRLDAGLAAEFMDETGHVKPAGSVVFNRDLAETLGSIRTKGPDGLYGGSVGTAIAAYTAAQGGVIAEPELGAYSIRYVTPRLIMLGDERVFVPGPGTGAGAFAGMLLNNLVRTPGAMQDNSNTEAVVVAATKQTLSGFGVTNLPNDLGSTGFAATDNKGQSAACAVTMNGPFGSGHTAQETGITLAKAPASSQAGLAAAFLTPVIATTGDGQLVLAGAGAGGPIGTASIADTLARLVKSQPVMRSGRSDRDIAPYDTVNAVLCQDGVCSALIDAGTHGLGAAPGR